MYPMLQVEFRQSKRPLIMWTALYALISLTLSRLHPDAVMAHLAALHLFTPLVFCGVSVTTGWRTLSFVRALPIPPGVIVASKYVAAALLIVAPQLLVVASSWIVSSRGTYLVMVAITALIAYAACSLLLLLHHRLGTKVAGASIVVASFGINIPLRALNRPETLTWLGDMEIIMGASGALLAANALGAIMMAGACYISIVTFARRDVTKMV